MSCSLRPPLLISSNAVLLILRTYALYNRKRAVALVLFGLLAVAGVFSAVRFTPRPNSDRKLTLALFRAKWALGSSGRVLLYYDGMGADETGVVQPGCIIVLSKTQ